MEIAAFVSVLIVEVGIAGFRFNTKLNQPKVNRVVRIGLFIVLAILLATSIIEWGFRWNGVALVMAVFTVPGHGRFRSAWGW